MPMQRSRTRAVIPGKRILGVAGAEKAQKATMGGAVVPGQRILGDRAAREQENARLARLGVAAVDPKAATGPAPKPAVSALDASLPPNKTAKTKTAQAKRVDPSYTEGEAVTMLEADPNAWAKVLDLESEQRMASVPRSRRRSSSTARRRRTRHSTPKRSRCSRPSPIRRRSNHARIQADVARVEAGHAALWLEAWAGRAEPATGARDRIQRRARGAEGESAGEETGVIRAAAITHGAHGRGVHRQMRGICTPRCRR